MYGYSFGWPYVDTDDTEKTDSADAQLSRKHGCDHEYINVGFYSLHMVCRHCDKEEEQK